MPRRINNFARIASNVAFKIGGLGLALGLAAQGIGDYQYKHDECFGTKAVYSNQLKFEQGEITRDERNQFLCGLSERDSLEREWQMGTLRYVTLPGLATFAAGVLLARVSRYFDNGEDTGERRD